MEDARQLGFMGWRNICIRNGWQYTTQKGCRHDKENCTEYTIRKRIYTHTHNYWYVHTCYSNRKLLFVFVSKHVLQCIKFLSDLPSL